jgi:hypothetical protein
MLFNRLTLTRTERTEMFRAESLELLARSRQPRLTNGSANHRNGSRTPLLREHNDTVPAAQAEQTNGRCPHTLEQSSAPQSPPRATAAAAGTPAPPDLLDPAVLQTMPPRVAAFMLYESREPPPWRQQETLSQRQHREQLENCGSWVGD